MSVRRNIEFALLAIKIVDLGRFQVCLLAKDIYIKGGITPLFKLNGCSLNTFVIVMHK